MVMWFKSVRYDLIVQFIDTLHYNSVKTMMKFIKKKIIIKKKSGCLALVRMWTFNLHLIVEVDLFYFYSNIQTHCIWYLMKFRDLVWSKLKSSTNRCEYIAHMFIILRRLWLNRNDQNHAMILKIIDDRSCDC